MRLGVWDENRLQDPREKIFRWRICGQGMEDEHALCGRCGFRMDRARYGHIHSLPLICPKCKQRLQGFSLMGR